MRETIATKGSRDLSEGRLIICSVDEYAGTLHADGRDNGAVYAFGRDESGWFCNRRARGDCARFAALRLVVAVEPPDY